MILLYFTFKKEGEKERKNPELCQFLHEVTKLKKEAVKKEGIKIEK